MTLRQSRPHIPVRVRGDCWISGMEVAVHHKPTMGMYDGKPRWICLRCGAPVDSPMTPVTDTKQEEKK